MKEYLLAAASFITLVTTSLDDLSNSLSMPEVCRHMLLNVPKIGTESLPASIPISDHLVTDSSWFQDPWTLLLIVSVTFSIVSLTVAMKWSKARKEYKKQPVDHINQVFQDLLKFSSSAIAMFDKNMHYMMANESWYRDYGLENQVIIGKSHYEVFPTIQSIPRWLDYHQRALAGESIKSDFDTFDHNGEKLYLKWSLIPWRQLDGSVGGVILTSEIINDQVSRQELLEQHQKDFSMLIDEMSGKFVHGRVEYDENDKPIDWVYLNVNKAFEQETGYLRTSVIGQKYSENPCAHSDEAEEWIQVCGSVAKTGKERTIVGYHESTKQHYEANLYSPRNGEFACIMRDVSAREIAVQKLKTSEGRFRNIFEKSSMGIVLTSTEGKPFLANSVFIDMLGYTEEELYSATFADFTHPDDLKKSWKNFHELLDGVTDSFTIKVRCIAKNKDLKHIRINVTMVDDYSEGGRYALALIEDQTEWTRARQEKDLADQKAGKMNKLLAEMSELAKTGSWEANFETDQFQWSNSVRDIFELSEDAVVNLRTIVRHFDRESRKKIRNGGIVDGDVSSWDLNLKILTRKGNEKWVRAVGKSFFAKGKLIELKGIFQDITTSVQHEIRLEQQTANQKAYTQKFTFAQSCSEFGIWDWDITNDILVWDDQMHKLYGTKESRFSSNYEAWTNGVHPDDLGIAQKLLEKALNGEQDFDTTFRILWPSGETRYLRAMATVFKSDDGRPYRMLGTNWDITNLAKSQNEILELNSTLNNKVEERTKELRQANAELESFAYSVSHDLRAPLRAIYGFSDVLINEYTECLDERGQNYLGRVSANVVKMGKLIDDILEFSRMNRKQKLSQSVDLSVVVDRVVNETFPSHKEKIRVLELPSVEGDPEMLEQVFVNLIGNAIKYSAKKSNPRIEIAQVDNGEKPCVSVTDNGVGFDMEHSSKLFTVFERLHNESDFEGTGVGLALCKKIINNHQGRIWAESEPDAGATFYLEFRPTSYWKN